MSTSSTPGGTRAADVRDLTAVEQQIAAAALAEARAQGRASA